MGTLNWPLPTPENSCFGGELFNRLKLKFPVFETPNRELVGWPRFFTPNWLLPNRLPVGGGPAGVDDGLNLRSSSGGGPAGVVDGGASRVGRLESGVEGTEDEGTRNIMKLYSGAARGG